MVDLPKRPELGWVKEDAWVQDLMRVEGCLGHLRYSTEQWLVIEPVADRPMPLMTPLAPSATRWAAASKAGADQPPPLSMQPYLTQSSGFRLSPSVSGFLGAGT